MWAEMRGAAVALVDNKWQALQMKGRGDLRAVVQTGGWDQIK